MIGFIKQGYNIKDIDVLSDDSCPTCKTILQVVDDPKFSDEVFIACLICEDVYRTGIEMSHQIGASAKSVLRLAERPVKKRNHKRCKQCKEGKPFREFYKNPIENDGLQTRCKECQREYRKYTTVKEGYMICVYCDKKKSSEEFYPQFTRANGKFSQCRECSIKAATIYKNKRYHTDSVYREKIKKLHRDRHRRIKQEEQKSA